MTSAEVSFAEFSRGNPCAGCPAPCCRLQLIPHKTPSTFMDLDFVRYMLLFPHTEAVVTISGEWHIAKRENCRAFEATTCTCKNHDTPQKPRTCMMFNPYNCWYKKNFVPERPPEVYRLNLTRFEVWVNEIGFAEDGRIILAPSFERSQEILRDMPIESYFGLRNSEALPPDPRLAATQPAPRSE